MGGDVMIHYSIEEFNYRGAAGFSTRGAVAIAIAPDSDVDCCLVNGRLLGVGSLLPVSAGDQITPFHGFRTGLSPALRGDPDTESLYIGKLTLLLYEPCDQMHAPGKRAPAIKEASVEPKFFQNNTIASPSDVYGLAMRHIVHGRKRGAIALRLGRNTGQTNPKFIVRFMRYHNREKCMQILGGGSAYLGAVQSYVQETAVQSFSFGASVINPEADFFPCGFLSWGSHGIQSLNSQWLWPDEIEVYATTDANIVLPGTRDTKRDLWVQSVAYDD